MATITVKSVKTNRTVSFDYAIGENLEEMVGLFGEAAVKDLAQAQLVIRVQAATRNALDALVTPDRKPVKPGTEVPADALPQFTEDQAIATGQGFQPGTGRVGRVASPEKAKAAVENALKKGILTREQILAMLAESGS